MTPLVHLITGPLSGVIGGLVAGARARARGADIVIIGAVMGAVVAVLSAVAVGILSLLTTEVAGKLPLLVPVVVFAFVGSTGSLGAWLGGRAAGSRLQVEPSADR